MAMPLTLRCVAYFLVRSCHLESITPPFAADNLQRIRSAMNVELPSPIAAYFAADRRGGTAVADCFAADAVVKDEGRVHRGPAAIRSWKDKASAKYQYT